MLRRARNTSSADAARCQGICPPSYETTLEVILYETNSHVTPVCLFNPSEPNARCCVIRFSELFQTLRCLTLMAAIPSSTREKV